MARKNTGKVVAVKSKFRALKPKKNVAKNMQLVRQPVSSGLFRPSGNFQKGPIIGSSIANVRFRGSGRKSVTSGRGLPDIVAAYIDPFDEYAGDLRYPDEFQGPTGTFTSTFVGKVTTSSAVLTDLNQLAANLGAIDFGSALFCVTPDPSNPIITAVVDNAAGTSIGNFHWPNGINQTAAVANAPNQLNAFGPTTGVLGTDTAVGAIGALRATFNSCRAVAGGLKLFSTQNFSTVSGTLHIAPVFIDMTKYIDIGLTALSNLSTPATTQTNNSWSYQLPTDIQQLSQMPGYCQFAMSALEEDEIVAIFKRVGEEALAFKPTGTAWGLTYPQAVAAASGSTFDTAKRTGTTATDGLTNYGHYCIVVLIDGVLASNGAALSGPTAVAEFEIRTHYECQYRSGGWLGGLSGVDLNGIYNPDAKKSSPHQPLLLAAADNLASDVPVVRCVDASGVEESNFIETVVGAWKGACRIATSVMGAVDIAQGLLAALVL